MKVDKTHMIFLLVLVGMSCVAGGGSVESMSEGDYTKMVGQRAMERKHHHGEHHGGGHHGGGGGHHGGGGERPGNEQILRVILVGLLLVFIAFLLL